MAKRRIQWIDFARGLGIILIVLSHVMLRGDTSKIIFSFHVPFFFIMAGYVLNLEKWSPRSGEFVEKIAKRLLLPYFIAEIIWYPIWFIFSHEMGFFNHLWRINEADPVSAFYTIFLGAVHNNYYSAVEAPLLLAPMWFFPCLFFAEIIYLGLYKIVGKADRKFVCLLIIAAGLGFLFGKFHPLIQALDVALVMQIFVAVGVLMRKFNFVEKINLPIIIAAIIGLFLSFKFNIFVDTNFRMYGNQILFYVGAIAGTVLIIKISYIFTKIGGKISDLITYCGLQSVLVVALHIPIIIILYDLIAALTSYDTQALLQSNRLIVIISTLSGVLIPLWLAKKFGKEPIIKYFCN